MDKKFYPSNWETYRTRDPLLTPVELGFTNAKERGDINRFCARFRAAAAYDHIVFRAGYTQDTELGYSAFGRVVFVWSAFEAYLNLYGKKHPPRDLLDHYGASAMLERLRRIDKHERFYEFISERANKKHGRELKSYLNNDVCNVGFLASSIRHIFIHGTLTPHSNRVSPKTVKQICDVLSDFLVNVMDKEFALRVEKAIMAAGK